MNFETVLAQGMGGLSMLVLLGIWLGILYILMIRPQKMKMQKHQQMVSAITKGTEVIIEGGIYGEIASVEDTFFMVKIAEKVIIKIDKQSIRAVKAAEEAKN